MRCYVSPQYWTNGSVVLAEDEAHHLVHVLRAEVGQPVVIFDGRGREADTRVKEIARDRVVLEMVQQRAVAPPPVMLTLIQALPREQKMDIVLQKATELGAAGIVPVVSDHGVVRIREGHETKRERWEKIVLNAAKQSGVSWLPKVQPISPLLDTLKSLPPQDVLLICSLEPDARPLRDVMADIKPLRPRSVGVLVGPEGDFSARELAAARQAGARPVSLGSAVFRVETAALYVLSILRYELSDL